MDGQAAHELNATADMPDGTGDETNIKDDFYLLTNAPTSGMMSMISLD